MNALWLYTLPCILLSLGRAAFATSPTVPLPPYNPLLKPLEQGDAISVHRIESKEGAGPVTRAMDRAQLGYDIPRLLSTARRCQSEALKGGTLNDLDTALYCSYIVRSSALLEGDALAYLQEVQWVRNTLYPAIKRVANDNPVFGTGLDSADLRQLTRTTPAVTENWLTGSQQLRFQAPQSRLEHRDFPAIDIQINGHKVAAFVEIYRGILRTPLTIVEPGDEESTLSAKLKLTPLVHDYINASFQYGGIKYQTTPSLYLVDEVRIGPLVLHHVAVGVVTLDSLPPGVYLNRSLWRRFGEVTISDTSIWLSRQSIHQCAPTVPMVFAANYYESGSLQFPISLNGATRIAALSLQVMDPMDIDSTAWIDTRKDPADAGARKDRKVKGPIAIQVGHQSFNVPWAYIETNWHEPFQVSLGRPILEKNTVQLQLRGGNPSICLAPNAGEANGRTR